MAVSFIAQLIALWLLAMAMTKHYRQTFGQRLSPQRERILTIAGWLLLTISLVFICMLSPLSLMLVYWVSFLAFNITAIAFYNSYQEHKK